MKRFWTFLAAAMLSVTAFGQLAAQTPGPTIANPQQPGVAPPLPAPGAATADHNPTSDTIIAFTGVALVMLAVCYPSRRI